MLWYYNIKVISLDKALFSLSNWRLIIRWSTSSAITIDTKIVCVHINVEKSVITPVCSPWVSTDPVFLSFLSLSPSNYSNFVVKLFISLFLVNICTIVGYKFISCFYTTSNWSILKNISFHLIYSAKLIIFISPVKSIFNCPTFILACFICWTRRPCAVLASSFTISN